MAQKYELTVALVGGGENLDFFDQDCARAYQDRPMVVLGADGSESLRRVLTRASEEFQAAYPGNYASAGCSLDFYRGDPMEGVTPTLPTTQTVTITDASGLAVWHVEPEDASIDDLVIASERKVFKGDPLRPYLLVDPDWGVGGPTPGGWDNLLQIWEALLYGAGSWQVLKGMFNVSKEAIELLDRVARRWRDHRSAAIYTRDFFERRDADIMDVIEAARAVMAYQLEDIMAWTGISDPAFAASVAGWAGFELDESSGLLSMMSDEQVRDYVSGLPIDLSIDWLPDDQEKAHAEVMRALGARLLEGDRVEPQ